MSENTRRNNRNYKSWPFFPNNRALDTVKAQMQITNDFALFYIGIFL